MAKTRSVRWLDDPEEKDSLAAHSYLSMVVSPGRLEGIIERLRKAPEGHWAAKDILRAAALAPVKPKESAEVAEKLAKVRAGKPISPVLLIAGLRETLTIADGYHRVSAAYRLDEDTMVPARLLWST